MKRALTAAVAASLLPVALAAPASASGNSAGPPFDLDLGVVKNVDIGAGGRLVLADSGETSTRVLSVSVLNGKPRTIAELDVPGTAAAAQSLTGHTWVVFGAPPESDEPAPSGPNIFHVSPSGTVRAVGSSVTYQAADLDPYDIEGNAAETNLYDVEALWDGSALIADAAGNDLLRVWKNGTIKTVACFPDELVGTGHIPFPADDPETPEVEEWPELMPAESVPTGVSIGLDGRAYVGELKGFPFAPGSSKVWRVNPNKYGQGCDGSPENPVAPGKVVASGFSGINDVTKAFDGSLYVTELHEDGVFAAEGGFEDPSSIAGKGRVSRVSHGRTTEVGDGKLTFPGSTAVTLGGRVLVSDTHLFGAQIVRIR